MCYLETILKKEANQLKLRKKVDFENIGIDSSKALKCEKILNEFIA